MYYLNNVNISTSITGVDEHWNFTQVIGSTQALTNRRNMNMNLFLSKDRNPSLAPEEKYILTKEGEGNFYPETI